MIHTRISSVYRSLLRRTRSSQGFTLVEVVIAAGLLVVMLVAIYTIWFGLQRTYSFTDDDMKAQAEARMALNEIVEYVRTARVPDSPPSDSLAMVIVSADANSLVCWTDVDRDSEHDLELVRFRVDEDNRILYRDQSQTGDITFSTGTSIRMVGAWVSNDESQPLFSYATASGSVLETPVVDPTQIREVTIDLHIDVYTDQAPIAHELRSVVQPRNLRQY